MVGVGEGITRMTNNGLRQGTSHHGLARLHPKWCLHRKLSENNGILMGVSKKNTLVTSCKGMPNVSG